MSCKCHAGTHDIQNVTVVAGDVPGEVLIGWNLIGSTDLKGYLAIVIGNTSVVHYQVTENHIQEGSQVDTITNLTTSYYSISLFTLRRDGLPENVPVSLPRMVSVVSGLPNTSEFAVLD